MTLKQMLASKTFWSAIGLVCYAIYQAATLNQFDEAVKTLLAALAAFGLRDAIAKDKTITLS